MLHTLSQLDVRYSCLPAYAPESSANTMLKGCRAKISVARQIRTRWTSIVIVVWFLALCFGESNQATIYLSSGSNGMAWNGNCNDGTNCGRNSSDPCALLDSTDVVLGSDPGCTLNFGTGSYRYGGIRLGERAKGQITLSFSAGLVSDFVLLGSTSFSQLVLTGADTSPLSSSLSNATIDIVTDPFLQAIFQFRLLNVSDSSVTLAGNRPWIMSSRFDASSIFINGTNMQLFAVSSTPSCNFTIVWSRVAGPGLQIVQSKLHTLTTHIFHFSNPASLVNFGCIGSTLSTRASNLLGEPLPATRYSISFTNCNVFSVLPNAQTTLLSMPTSSSLGSIDLTLRDTNNFTNISINIDPPFGSSQMTFDISNTQFINCPININADLLSLSWTGTNFITQFEPQMPAILRRQAFSPAHRFSSLVYSNPNRLPGNYLALNSPSPSFGNFTSTSLDVSNLHLGASHVPIESALLVSNSIIANVTGGATLEHVPISPASPSAPSWTFRSIDITNVILAPSGDSFTLEYVPSEPNKGVKLTNSSWSQNPLQITVNWHSTLLPPKKFGVYPLVELSGMREIGSAFDLAPKPGVDWIFLGTFTSPTFLSFIALSPDFNQNGTLCKGPIPDGFECSVDGTLYSLTPVNSASLTLPSGSGTVLVVGNMTVNSGVVFSGAGSNLVVTGCALVEQVVLDLSKDTGLHEGPMDLITQSPSCTNSLNNVELNIKLPPKDGCKQMKATRQGSGTSHLSVLIRIDTSGCNTKWIILGAVLGSLALILVIVFLILVLHPTTRGYLPCFIKPMKEE